MLMTKTVTRTMTDVWFLLLVEMVHHDDDVDVDDDRNDSTHNHRCVIRTASGDDS